MAWWEVLIAIFAAIGGFETVKYFINRKQNKRIAEAQADSDEFKVLREQVQFLQEQLIEKEKRFAEQTNQVRSLNNDVFTLLKEKAQIELEHQRYKCVVANCVKRQPQNGY